MLVTWMRESVTLNSDIGSELKEVTAEGYTIMKIDNVYYRIFDPTDGTFVTDVINLTGDIAEYKDGNWRPVEYALPNGGFAINYYNLWI